MYILHFQVTLNEEQRRQLLQIVKQSWKNMAKMKKTFYS